MIINRSLFLEIGSDFLTSKGIQFDESNWFYDLNTETYHIPFQGKPPFPSEWFVEANSLGFHLATFSIYWDPDEK